MPNFISKIEVDGTEYDVVGTGGEYPIAVQLGQAEHVTYSTYTVPTSFYWRRDGDGAGNYEYTLVVTTGGTGPEYYEYSDDSGS